jgi:hypothetical protein
MLFGGQATTDAGVPVVLATEATTVVAPGCRDVTTPLVSDVATTVFPVAHVNGPTSEVMSLPLLNAFAVNCSV